MSNRHTNHMRAAGFSMIDVLVAIVVLATALLALAALQGALTRNAADSRARSQIASYAEGLIDQLRSGGYDNIANATVTSDCSKTATLQGTEACDAQTAAGVSNLKSVITTTHFYYDGTKYVTAAPATFYSDYQQVNVVTTWTDATGASRQLGLDTIISPIQVSSGNTLDTFSLSSSTSVTPVVHQFDPGKTDGVIPIAIGNGSDTAATNPQPEILGSSKNQSLGGVSYNVLTYKSASISGFSNQVSITQLVDTRVIGCHCTYGSGVTDTTSVFAQPYRPTYWDGTKYHSPPAAGWKFSNFGPDANYSRTQTNLSNGFTATQDEFCDICCRDRNDTAADAMKFNPWNSDFDHYAYSGNTLNTTPVAAAPSTNGSSTWPSDTTSYVNACRIIRVDGQYAVATDLQNYFFGLLETDTASNAKVPSGSSSTLTASSPLPTSSAKTNYTDFVTTYLGENLPSTGGAGGATITATSFPYDVPSDSTSVSSGTTLTNAAALWNTKGLNTPANISDLTYNSATPDYRYLHARGFFIDHLETDAVKAINDAITNCTATDLAGVEDCVFPFVPFTTINLTQLVNWTVESGKNVINVTDTAITGGNADQPLRGVVNAVSTAKTGDSQKAYATVGQSTTGVVGFSSDWAITPTDLAATLTQGQLFTVSSGSSSGGVPVYFTTALANLTQMLTNKTTADPSVSWAGTSAQIGTAASGTTTPFQTGSSGSYSVLYVGSVSGQKYTPITFTPTNTVASPAGWPLSVTVQKYNAQTTGSGGSADSNCAPEVATQCTVSTISSVTINGSSVSGWTTAFLNSDTTGLNAGTILTLPNPSTPGFTSTDSANPDALVITFAKDNTNSYSCGLSGASSNCATAATCTKQGTKYKYTAGTCGN